VDAGQSVLLVRYRQIGPTAPDSFWVPPGGALEPGESHPDAAIREMREETGLTASIGEELWRRRFTLELPGGAADQRERYFLVRLQATAPPVRNSSPEAIEEHRWWSLRELEATTEVVYPAGFASALKNVLGRGIP
jgi:8-oxo-dGTP pyrophosphatase MutT (NUDIX family)